MFTFDVHSLLDGKKKKVPLAGPLIEDYKVWRGLLEGINDNPSVMEAFYAGYLIGNNVTLKERFLKLRSSQRLIDKTFGGKR